MSRKMCKECPFRPGSSMFRVRDAWFQNLKEKSVHAHGCHMIHDEPTEDPNLVCIGLKDAFDGTFHEETA